MLFTSLKSICVRTTISREGLGTLYTSTKHTMTCKKDETHKSLIQHHPPTQILHGSNDPIVPVDMAQRYHQNLAENSINPTRLITTDEGHTWIQGSANAVFEWIELYN